jgi:hypothetical protein
LSRLVERTEAGEELMRVFGGGEFGVFLRPEIAASPGYKEDLPDRLHIYVCRICFYA